MIRLLPKLEELENNYAQACSVFNPFIKHSYKRVEKIDKKIEKIRNKIKELYIGNKSNARNVLLLGM